MATQPTPYVPRDPGDLITAGDWNEVQVDVKKDIADQVKTAVDQIKKVKVEQAGDADTLGGKTPQQIEDEITNRIFEKLPARTGYRMLFKRLKTQEEKVIKHGLKAFPLVDVYQLDYFKVVCAKGETKEEETPAQVNFYLYHTSERRIRVPGTPTVTVDIEPPDTQPYRIPFADMLALYKVSYTDTTTLDDLETDFWTAFFADPNDQFDPDQYCHSPWFEKCCGEQRSVKQLKDRGDWDDIWLKMEPTKTAIYLKPKPPEITGTPGALSLIQVAHHDFDTLGLTLLEDPTYPTVPASDPPLPEVSKRELKIMVLLKV